MIFETIKPTFSRPPLITDIDDGLETLQRNDLELNAWELRKLYNKGRAM